MRSEDGMIGSLNPFKVSKEFTQRLGKIQHARALSNGNFLYWLFLSCLVVQNRGSGETRVAECKETTGGIGGVCNSRN